MIIARIMVSLLWREMKIRESKQWMHKNTYLIISDILKGFILIF